MATTSPDLYFGLLGIVAGALIAGLMTLLNTVYQQCAERRRQLRREAMEALLSVHDALTDIATIYGKFSAIPVAAMLGTEVKNPWDGLQTPQNIARLRYHLGLYAPELRTRFEEILTEGANAMDQWTSSLVPAATNTWTVEQATALVDSMTERSRAVLAFQKELADYGYKHYVRE